MILYSSSEIRENPAPKGLRKQKSFRRKSYEETFSTVDGTGYDGFHAGSLCEAGKRGYYGSSRRNAGSSSCCNAGTAGRTGSH